MFYESDKITKTYDPSAIIFEESFESTISQMKSLMNRTMITSNLKIRSISEKKDATNPQKHDIAGATSVMVTEMRNAVFALKNDRFDIKDQEELRSKVQSKQHRVRAAENDFQKKNHDYESNKNIWKDQKVNVLDIRTEKLKI